MKVTLKGTSSWRHSRWSGHLLATAKTYVIQPLTRNKIERFLFDRQTHLPENAALSQTDYVRPCANYLAEALNENQPKEVFTSAKRILSNPMDLTVVAQILARGGKPDLFHLLEQQYKIMSEDYTRVNVHQEFPLSPFSEAVYEMKLKDEGALPEADYLKALSCMARHKMVVIRQALDAKGYATKEWHFGTTKSWNSSLCRPSSGMGTKDLSSTCRTRVSGVFTSCWQC